MEETDVMFTYWRRVTFWKLFGEGSSSASWMSPENFASVIASSIDIPSLDCEESTITESESAMALLELT